MMDTKTGLGVDAERIEELQAAAAAARAVPESTRRAVVELGELDGRDGFALIGETAGDNAGWSVSGAGDVNGDGVADLIVGAPEYGIYDYSYRYTDPGAAYVVYGSSAGFSTQFDLGELNGTNGFRITDISHYNGYYNDYGYQDDGIGLAVAALGDVNGDGVDDIAVGAGETDPTGAVHIVFGSSSTRSASMNATGMDAATGFTIVGETSYDYVGYAVSSAGDVNGDGVADILIGAYNQETGGSSAGAAYVVYGRTSGFVRTLSLSDLNGSNGFVLDGDAYDNMGRSVAAAGDVNGDGVDDILVGSGARSEAYVVYGTAAGTSARRNLSDLTDGEGFAITSTLTDDQTDWSVAGIGDVNGDGTDDILIGADDADGGGVNSGAAYVVFGGAEAAGFDVADLDGTNGFTLVGANSSDYAGFSVTTAGDFNGDGLTDLAIGARLADPNGSNSGEAYIVFGSRTGFAASIDLGDLNGSDGLVLRGANRSDYAGWNVSGTGDINGDGYDDLIIGAWGADGGGSSSGEAYVVYGFASNVGPAPQDDAITVQADEAMSGDLFADNGDGADVDADGDALTVTAVNGSVDGVGTALTLASGAVLTVRADGGFGFDAEGADGAYASLGEGETATEAFTYAVSDGLGGMATATATLTVTGVNDAPQAAGESAEATAGDAPLVIDVLANDTDVDASDVLFVRSVSGGTGTTTLTDGVVTYAADAFAGLAEGDTTLDTFSYVVADEHGGTDTGTVTVQVTGVNDAPEIGAVALALSADGQAVFDLADVASDVDQGAALTYAISGVPGGTASIEGGTLTFAADGAWDALALGQTAEATITVTVTDEHGASATTAAALTITGVNDAPMAAALMLTAGQDDGTVTADLTSAAGDVDEGAALTFALAEGAPEGASLTADGALAFALGDAFAGLAEGETATRQLAYTVTDEHGASADAVATLTITGANDAPTAAGGALAVTENGAAQIDLSALVTDADAGAILSVTLGEDAPASASLADGVLLYEAGAAFEALGAGETRTEVVGYEVTDEHGEAARAEVAVTVTGINDAPTLTGGTRRAVFTEDETAAAAIAAGVVFADVDSPDLGGAVVTAELAGGGEHWFVMLVADQLRLSADSVVFDGAVIGRFETRREFVSVTMAEGADADDLQAVLDALAFSGGRGDDLTEGVGTVTVTVTDGAADDPLAPEGTQDGVASFVTEVEVVGANDAPVAVDDAETASEKAQLVFDPRENDQDAEGDALRITGIDGQAVVAGDVVTLASGATVELMADGRLTYDPGEAFYGLTGGEEGTDGFAYELTDAGGAASVGEVSLTIRGEDGGLVWSGTAGADEHEGTADADVMDGGGGDDVLSGGDGADSLMGGGGDDVLYGDAGPEAVAAAMAALAEAGLA